MFVFVVIFIKLLCFLAGFSQKLDFWGCHFPGVVPVYIASLTCAVSTFLPTLEGPAFVFLRRDFYYKMYMYLCC